MTMFIFVSVRTNKRYHHPYDDPMILQQMIKDAGVTVNKTQMKLEMPKGKAS
jgi:hypothetical protein